MRDGHLGVMVRFLSAASTQADAQVQLICVHPINEDAKGGHGQRSYESSAWLLYRCRVPIRKGQILFFAPESRRPASLLGMKPRLVPFNACVGNMLPLSPLALDIWI